MSKRKIDPTQGNTTGPKPFYVEDSTPEILRFNHISRMARSEPMLGRFGSRNYDVVAPSEVSPKKNACHVCRRTDESGQNKMVECYTCTTVQHKECIPASKRPTVTDDSEWQCDFCRILISANVNFPAKKKTDDASGSNSQTLTIDSETSGGDSEVVILEIIEKKPCLVCRKTGTTSQNKMVECYKCPTVYHKECVPPSVREDVSSPQWLCDFCRISLAKVEFPAKKTKPDETCNSSSPTLTIQSGISGRGSDDLNPTTIEENVCVVCRKTDIRCYACQSVFHKHCVPLSVKENIDDPQWRCEICSILNEYKSESTTNPEITANFESVFNPEDIASEAPMDAEIPVNPEASVSSNSTGKPSLSSIQVPVLHPRSILKPKYK